MPEKFVDPMFNGQRIHALTQPQLVSICASLKLDTMGDVTELRNRMIEHVDGNPPTLPGAPRPEAPGIPAVPPRPLTLDEYGRSLKRQNAAGVASLAKEAGLPHDGTKAQMIELLVDAWVNPAADMADSRPPGPNDPAPPDAPPAD